MMVTQSVNVNDDLIILFMLSWIW